MHYIEISNCIDIPCWLRDSGVWDLGEVYSYYGNMTNHVTTGTLNDKQS